MRLESIMTIKIVYLPPTAKTEKALSAALDALAEKLSAPEVPLTGSEILPLVTATIGLAEVTNNLGSAVSVLGQRIAIYEATASSEAPKPASGYATKLDQRLTATSDLLRACLERVDQLETAVMRLYRPPFLEIDPNDQRRKKLASLKVEVRCLVPSGKH
jgi:hypothetical protein